MASNPVFATLRRAWEVLRPLNVPTAVMGGIALAAWECVRATQDVDLLVGIDRTHSGDALARLRAAGFRPLHDPPARELADFLLFQFEYSPPGTFLDIQLDLLAAGSEFHSAALSRRVAITLPGMDVPVFVLACEDLILFKLVSGRIVDRADCAALLAAHSAAVDRGHLMHWAKRLGVSAELAELWATAVPGTSLDAT